MKIIFITGNANKLDETRSILKEYETIPYKTELEELQGTREEISIRKCQVAYDKIKDSGEFADLKSYLILVEDSSFYVNEYYPLPGVYIKEFLKLEPVKFLEMFSKCKDRGAEAYCTFALHNGKDVTVVEGCLKGKLAHEARGNDGFGWDKYFIPEDCIKTVAGMNFDEKNAISQRRIAIENLRVILKKLSKCSN